MKPENLEKLAGVVERLDNLVHALKMPLPADIHLMGIKPALPELHEELKAISVDEGFDWS